MQKYTMTLCGIAVGFKVNGATFTVLHMIMTFAESVVRSPGTLSES
jgi:hypothetical protein